MTTDNTKQDAVKDEGAVFGNEKKEEKKTKAKSEMVEISKDALEQMMRNSAEIQARLAKLESERGDDNGEDDIDILDLKNRKKQMRVSFYKDENGEYVVVGLGLFTRANGDQFHTENRQEANESGVPTMYTYIKVRLQNVESKEIVEKDIRNALFASVISPKLFEVEEIDKQEIDATPNKNERVESTQYVENNQTGRISQVRTGSLVKASAKTHVIKARVIIGEHEYWIDQSVLNMVSLNS